MQTTLRSATKVLAAVILALSLSFAPSAQTFAQDEIQETLQNWEFEKGDWMIANTAENSLQFVREDYSDLSPKVRIGSGKNDGKAMSYLGLRYDPKTPEKVWEIRSSHQQNWYNVFGSEESDEQLFLRLYEVKGEQRIWTHYGIHTTPTIETIFEKDQGYGSWGCVLTRYDLLKQIETLYTLNEKVIRVVTTTQSAEEVVELLKAF